MIRLFLKYLLIFSAFSAFSQDKYFTIAADKIDSVLVIQPSSSTFLYIKGKWVYDMSMSAITTQNLMTGFKTYFPGNIRTVEPDLDTTVLRKIDNEMKAVRQTFKTSRKEIIQNAYSMMFDSLMDAHRCKYLLVLDQAGFTRTRKQLSKEVALSAGLRILSGGMFGSPVSAKMSSMSCHIFGRDAKGVVFQSSSYKMDQEPTDPETTDRQIRQMFEGYFIKKKR